MPDDHVELLQLKATLLQCDLLKALLEHRMEDGDDFGFTQMEQELNSLHVTAYPLFRAAGLDTSFEDD